MRHWSTGKEFNETSLDVMSSALDGSRLQWSLGQDPWRRLMGLDRYEHQINSMLQGCMMVEIKLAQDQHFEEIWSIINSWRRNEHTGNFF